MTDPWIDAPEDLEPRLQKHLRLAARANLPPDLVGRYARIHIAAEEVVRHRLRKEQEVREETVRVAALEHGIYEQDAKKARRAYAAARQGQREVYASATGMAQRLAKFGRLLETRHRYLQVDVAARFPLSRIVAASKLMQDFALATKPHPANLAEVKFAKSELSLTEFGHTFTWWRTEVPRYKDKWNDMHLLARCWRLTGTDDLETFQRLVRKLKPERDRQGRTWILGCPPWALS